jgi:ribose 5-phosphate isomerase A
MTTLDAARWLDLTIDGADEVAPGLSLIKGAGGALLHEKIVATASDRMVAIVARPKLVGRLGAVPLPVEVLPFGASVTIAQLEAGLAGMEVASRVARTRMDGAAPYVTEEGNMIVDLHLGRIDDPTGLSRTLERIPGVVATGLFLGICDAVVVGYPDGSVETRRPGDAWSDAADNIFGHVRD